jgi:hypothetical protein
MSAIALTDLNSTHTTEQACETIAESTQLVCLTHSPHGSSWSVNVHPPDPLPVSCCGSSTSPNLALAVGNAARRTRDMCAAYLLAEREILQSRLAELDARSAADVAQGKGAVG